MNYETFRQHNFMVVDNLKRRGLSDGQLNLSLEFKEILDKNYLLIIVPMCAQILEFDEHFNAQMRTSSASELDRADKAD